MSEPSISVVVVTWNHRSFLPGCLDALLSQAYPRLDVLVVDNASTDGSARWLARSHPDLPFHVFPANRGFSAALNWGIDHTQGDWVLSLNPDVVVRPGFLQKLIRVARRGKRAGAVAPKLLRADDPTLLDSTGLFIRRNRSPYDRGQGEPDRGQYDASPFVFGACGAAALYRRDMLEDLAIDGEIFDEGFFAYYEDADLAWRAHQRGWEGVYAPQAVATHVRGWGDTLRRRGHATKAPRGPRLALRNRYLMCIKNDAWRYFLADLPRILAAELPRAAYAAVTMPSVLLGWFDLLRQWPQAMEKRRQVRARKTVTDAQIRRWFTAPHAAAEGRA